MAYPAYNNDPYPPSPMNHSTMHCPPTPVQPLYLQTSQPQPPVEPFYLTSPVTTCAAPVNGLGISHNGLGLTTPHIPPRSRPASVAVPPASSSSSSYGLKENWKVSALRHSESWRVSSHRQSSADFYDLRSRRASAFPESISEFSTHPSSSPWQSSATPDLMYTTAAQATPLAFTSSPLYPPIQTPSKPLPQEPPQPPPPRNSIPPGGFVLPAPPPPPISCQPVQHYAPYYEAQPMPPTTYDNYYYSPMTAIQESHLPYPQSPANVTYTSSSWQPVMSDLPPVSNSTFPSVAPVATSSVTNPTSALTQPQSSSPPSSKKDDKKSKRKKDTPERKIRQITVQSINKEHRVWINVEPTETGLSLAEKIQIIATFRTRKILKITTASGRPIPLDHRPVFGSWMDMDSFVDGERWQVEWGELDKSVVDRLFAKVVQVGGRRSRDHTKQNGTK
ncbi:uncharacterized protein BYT42DRAFT_582592 [Radiomyces spectabilis]|uniref:uncharacterized protein n=1 Tax=Radiomyces spectabilis TaxID=64574 RepID=UPI00221EACE0|nr:uncharacterized protein BYT42DRAFT_582592 [Radiomyces spectabilis]KAI8370484.1 hypothetical protein BYT42DRAFT_582592 [Radiomyces spectabilis]